MIRHLRLTHATAYLPTYLPTYTYKKETSIYFRNPKYFHKSPAISSSFGHFHKANILPLLVVAVYKNSLLHTLVSALPPSLFGLVQREHREPRIQGE